MRIVDLPSSGLSGMTAQRLQCFKTKRCRFWLENRCSRGDKCTYAHTDVELRCPPDLTKTKICTRWKRGACDKSPDECAYAHGLDDLREEPAATKSNSLSSRHNPDKRSVSFEPSSGHSMTPSTSSGTLHSSSDSNTLKTPYKSPYTRSSVPSAEMHPSASLSAGLRTLIGSTKVAMRQTGTYLFTPPGNIADEDEVEQMSSASAAVHNKLEDDTRSAHIVRVPPLSFTATAPNQGVHTRSGASEQSLEYSVDFTTCSLNVNGSKDTLRSAESRASTCATATQQSGMVYFPDSASDCARFDHPQPLHCATYSNFMYMRPVQGQVDQNNLPTMQRLGDMPIDAQQLSASCAPTKLQPTSPHSGPAVRSIWGPEAVRAESHVQTFDARRALCLKSALSSVYHD